MGIAKDRSNGDRTSPLHSVVIILIYDSLQSLNRTHRFRLIFVAQLVIPLDFSFLSYVVLKHFSADVPKTINLVENRVDDHSPRHVLRQSQVLKRLWIVQVHNICHRRLRGKYFVEAVSSNCANGPIILRATLFASRILRQRPKDELSTRKNELCIACLTIARRLAQAAVQLG